MQTKPKPTKPAEYFHPGEYIAEELEARGWTRATLAATSGLDRRIIDELIAEKRSVTRLIAHCLGLAFGTGHQVWRNLQATWDSRLEET